MNELLSPDDPAVRYTTRIDLDDRHLRTIRKILAQHLPQARVMAFGSRVSGRPRKYSDLDLAVDLAEPFGIRTLRKLKDALEDSDLPICVDIVDWGQASGEFKKAVSKQGMCVIQPKASKP